MLYNHVMEINNKCDEVMEVLFKMTNHFTELGKKPQRFRAELLYPSEIQVLCIVEKYPSNNITELAQKLGVTKGAVSQVTGRLVTKKIIEKINPHNQKEICLTITDYGMELLAEFRQECYMRNCEIKQLMERLDNDQLNLLKTLFADIDELISSQL